MKNVTLDVDRTDYGKTRLAQDDLAIGDGEVLFRVDRFAITANNVTYAVAGDMLDYWGFFPTGDPGWGRVPAMGWAEVVESRVADVRVGDRYYGWFPMAQYASMTATPTKEGLRDDGAHRLGHAAVYRSYVRTDRDPWYQPAPDAEDRHALLRGLFLTGFLAEEFFADENYYDAEQVIVLSASSKTAIGFAQRSAARGGIKVIGLTSQRNASFVESLGFYDQVITYDNLSEIAEARTVMIDMAGNSSLVSQIHDRLADKIGYSMAVGMSHHDAPRAAVRSGPSPVLFFAPSEVARRLEEWGGEGYGKRTTDALFDFVEASREWLSIETAVGPDAATETWSNVFEGRVPPSVGCTVTLHDAS